MAGIGDNSREGSRHRSFSESDSDRISDVTFRPANINNRNPDIGSEDELPVFQSHPNLSSLTDEYIESPLWSGRGTRFQRRQTPLINDKYEKARNDCLSLLKDVDKWFECSSDEPDKMYEDIEKFKRRIARASQEGLIRLVDKNILDQLASKQIRLESLRKRIDKEERQRLNPSLSIPISSSAPRNDIEFNPARESTSSEDPNPRIDLEPDNDPPPLILTLQRILVPHPLLIIFNPPKPAFFLKYNPS